MSEPRRVPVPGSERHPLPGARAVGDVDPDERLEVTVVLRRRAGSEGPAVAARQAGRPLDRDELERLHGADVDDIGRVEDFAHAHGLDVVAADAARRSVVLAGTVASLGTAFGVTMRRYEAEGTTFRGRTGPVHVPAELGGVVEGVFGLDDRPQTRPHLRRAPTDARLAGYTPLEVGRLYSFPEGLDGSGECIAIIELGGGYRAAEVAAYFERLGVRAPRVVAVSVDGGRNAPTGDPSGPDGEVLLDIEVAGALAPGARLAVYFAPNTERGFLDAVAAAVHDRVRRPAVISISWGGPEATWTQQALRLFDQVFEDAAALGVSVLAAAGDDGSADRFGDGRAHCDFPASSPSVLACGGTRLDSAGGIVTAETVWNDGRGGAGGGGISDVFDVPAYQVAADPPPSANPGGRRGRGVPDVAGNADPRTGYRVVVDGVEDVVGGTSAVAPLWAALLARVNQALGAPVGAVHERLYADGERSGALRDITSGDNGAYSARTGWDPCTGLGSPDGTALLRLLREGAARAPR